MGIFEKNQHVDSIQLFIHSTNIYLKSHKCMIVSYIYDNRQGPMLEPKVNIHRFQTIFNPSHNFITDMSFSLYHNFQDSQFSVWENIYRHSHEGYILTKI